MFYSILSYLVSEKLLNISNNDLVETSRVSKRTFIARIVITSAKRIENIDIDDNRDNL